MQRNLVFLFLSLMFFSFSCFFYYLEVGASVLEGKTRPVVYTRNQSGLQRHCHNSDSRFEFGPHKEKVYILHIFPFFTSFLTSLLINILLVDHQL